MCLVPYTKIPSLHLLLVSVFHYYTTHIDLCKHHSYFHHPERMVEELLTLEAKYGPISGYKPAINDVLNYLSEVPYSMADSTLYLVKDTLYITLPQLNDSTNERDMGMRTHLYFMLSVEGSLQSQMVRFNILC